MVGLGGRDEKRVSTMLRSSKFKVKCRDLGGSLAPRGKGSQI